MANTGCIIHLFLLFIENIDSFIIRKIESPFPFNFYNHPRYMLALIAALQPTKVNRDLLFMSYPEMLSFLPHWHQQS